MGPIKLVVIDLDDTLLRSDESVTDYTVSIFRQLHERKLRIAFATARSLESSQSYRDLIQPDADVVTGGCLVLANGHILQSYYLPKPQCTQLLTELAEHKPNKLVSARSISNRYANKPVEDRICVDFRYPLDDELIHCSCRTNDDDFMKSIAERYLDFSFIRQSGSDLYDINPRQATKLNGIKLIAKHFSIPLSEVIAFGDNNSDLEMLRECGVGVAMSNAIDACKEVSDFVCGHCDDDGVAHWLEDNLLSQ